MNIKRLIFAVLAGFAFIFATDVLIHGFWLGPTYKATAALWRPEAEMQARMPWMMGGQFLAASTFAILWAIGCAQRGTFGRACLFGLLMGLFNQANTLIDYAVWPLPPDLAVKWFVGCLGQCVSLGLLNLVIYKPVIYKPAAK